MRFQVLAFTLLVSLTGLAQTDIEACRKSYEKIYGDGELTMSVFLGYSDADNYVADRLNKIRMVEQITGACGSGRQLCGFTRDPDDADVFTKTITRVSGKKDKVRLRIMNSAVTSDHTTNTGDMKEQQQKQSKAVEEAYIRALQTDDVVMYNGHARRGTGPGFKPMSASDWTAAVATRPSLQRVIQTLKKSKKTPAVIGMFTCEGESHYGKALQDSAPNSGLILTRQTSSFHDTDAIMDASMEGILQQYCGPKFRSDIKGAVAHIYSSPLDGADSYKDKLPEVYNFFEPNKKKFAPPRGAILTLLNGQFEEHTSRAAEEAKEKERQQKAKSGR